MQVLSSVHNSASWREVVELWPKLAGYSAAVAIGKSALGVLYERGVSIQDHGAYLEMAFARIETLKSDDTTDSAEADDKRAIRHTSNTTLVANLSALGRAFDGIGGVNGGGGGHLRRGPYCHSASRAFLLLSKYNIIENRDLEWQSTGDRNDSTGLV
jgi:hypothetical protein